MNATVTAAAESAVTLLALCRTAHADEAREALRELVARVAPACASLDEAARVLGVGRSTLAAHLRRWREEGRPVTGGWAPHRGRPAPALAPALAASRAAARASLPLALRARLSVTAVSHDALLLAAPPVGDTSPLREEEQHLLDAFLRARMDAPP